MSERSFDGRLRIGDCVRTTSVRAEFPGMAAYLKADKGMVFVFVLIGEEAKDGSAPLDIMAAIERLGWIRLNAAER